jgi:hypothetical protein
MNVPATERMFSISSKARLTRRDLGRFSGDALFARLARAVCQAGCLPRKELYEAWEMARRVRRRFRGGRIVDLGAGHGLLSHVLLILDDSSPGALLVDVVPPKSAGRLHTVLVQAWPRLAGRLTSSTQPLESVSLAAADLVVSSHACGGLTDQDLALSQSGSLSGWMDESLAVDVMRAVRLEQRGYRIWTQTIPAAITPKNRLLMGEPLA